MKRLAPLLLLLSGCAHAPTYTLTVPQAAPPTGIYTVGGEQAALAATDSLTLRWTYPTRTRVPLPGGVPWRTICAPGADALDRVTALRVTGRVASATWRDSSARMLADTLSWRRNWSRVATEADERVILLRVYADSLAWRMPGARDSARVARWTWYSLAVANAVGWSCERMVSR